MEIIQFGSEMAAPVTIEDTSWHRSNQLHKECGWKRGDSLPVAHFRGTTEKTLDLGRPSHGSGAYSARKRRAGKAHLGPPFADQRLRFGQLRCARR